MRETREISLSLGACVLNHDGRRCRLVGSMYRIYSLEISELRKLSCVYR